MVVKQKKSLFILCLFFCLILTSCSNESYRVELSEKDKQILQYQQIQKIGKHLGYQNYHTFSLEKKYQDYTVTRLNGNYSDNMIFINNKTEFLAVNITNNAVEKLLDFPDMLSDSKEIVIIGSQPRESVITALIIYPPEANQEISIQSIFVLDLNSKKIIKQKHFEKKRLIYHQDYQPRGYYLEANNSIYFEALGYDNGGGNNIYLIDEHNELKLVLSQKSDVHMEANFLYFVPREMPKSILRCDISNCLGTQATFFEASTEILSYSLSNGTVYVNGSDGIYENQNYIMPTYGLEIIQNKKIVSSTNERNTDLSYFNRQTKQIEKYPVYSWLGTIKQSEETLIFIYLDYITCDECIRVVSLY